MLWQLGIGFLGGMIYGLMDADKKKVNYSVAPKAEPINDLTDEQIKRILLTPKVKKIVEDIIKAQSGVVNVFDPEWYYNNEDKVLKREEEAKAKPYILKIEDDD